RHVRLGDGRAQGQVAYVCAHLISARVQFYVNGVDGVTARRKSRVRHPEVNEVCAALGGRVQVFGLDEDANVLSLAGDVVAAVVVVYDGVRDLNVCGRVGEEDSLVRVGRRNLEDGEVGAAFGVVDDPDFGLFDDERLEVDVAAQE